MSSNPDSSSSDNLGGLPESQPGSLYSFAETQRLKKKRATERRKEWVRMLCRRLTAVMVISVGATAGLFLHDIAVGVPLAKIIRQFPAILLGGPVLGFGMVMLALFSVGRSELKRDVGHQLFRRAEPQSNIFSNPWMFLRFLFLLGPPAAWALNAEHTGLPVTWSGVVSIVSGSLFSGVAFWATSVMLGGGRVLD